MPATSSVHPAITATAAPRCQAAELALRPGPGISPMTGEHGAFYALVNRSHTACTIIGYPAIVTRRGAGSRAASGQAFLSWVFVVGMARFELAASCSQSIRGVHFSSWPIVLL